MEKLFFVYLSTSYGLNYFSKSHDSIYCVALIIAWVICSSFIFE